MNPRSIQLEKIFFYVHEVAKVVLSRVAMKEKTDEFEEIKILNLHIPNQ